MSSRHQEATAAVIIVAAGSGSRALTDGSPPKQYALLGGRPVLERAIAPFANHPGIGDVCIVVNPDDAAHYGPIVAGFGARLLAPAAGGATRQMSVSNGLAALAERDARLVLIHDAARPFVTPSLIDRVLAALGSSTGAIPGLAVADTLKAADAVGRITGTVPRAGLFRAQTPQGFRFSDILAAHRRARAEGREDFTDDAALAEWAGMEVTIVPGEEANIKLTTPEDLAMAARRLGLDDVRMATGFDVHAFAEGDHVWLCGVRIPHTHRLDGHSDADVALHALTDAILGAIADGDIGQHFPPSDPKWKGAASHHFLADAARRVRSKGGEIAHVDVTILCEAPRIAPHREAMRARIAEILSIPIGAVSVKATTTEGLGFVGRREGIAAQAAATVRLPRAR
jgi:2-C-methyl-D-erythritol 4-phosphate cytidylyltransferase/2-C-methyl-D-erythritol 2,4-cyclodiphosphate synthase